MAILETILDMLIGLIEWACLKFETLGFQFDVSFKFSLLGLSLTLFDAPVYIIAAEFLEPPEIGFSEVDQ